MSTHLKNIAIVGASGNAGAPITSALLASPLSFNVTAISRADSNSTFPSSSKLTVKKGSYDDHAFLVSALKGQDAFIILLGFAAAPDTQTKLIAAAAEAGVPWVLPCEFGGDTTNPKHTDGIPMLQSKLKDREQVVELSKGRSSWIGFSNAMWFEYVSELSFPCAPSTHPSYSGYLSFISDFGRGAGVYE